MRRSFPAVTWKNIFKKLGKFLTDSRFDNLERSIRPKGTTEKDREDYNKAIGEKIGFRTRKSEGAKLESKFDQFNIRLDFYSLILFSTLSCDLKVQLANVNSRLAQKFLADYKISYEQLYFEMLDKIIDATPVHFRSLLLRNWINVSSDIWETNSAQMLNIVKQLEDKDMKRIDTFVISPSAEFNVFCNKSVVQELRSTAIGFREDLKTILNDRKVRSKDKIFDPDR